MSHMYTQQTRVLTRETGWVGKVRFFPKEMAGILTNGVGQCFPHEDVKGEEGLHIKLKNSNTGPKQNFIVFRTTNLPRLLICKC